MNMLNVAAIDQPRTAKVGPHETPIAAGQAWVLQLHGDEKNVSTIVVDDGAMKAIVGMLAAALDLEPGASLSYTAITGDDDQATKIEDMVGGRRHGR
jgi:hypothetical protein